MYPSVISRCRVDQGFYLIEGILAVQQEDLEVKRSLSGVRPTELVAKPWKPLDTGFQRETSHIYSVLAKIEPYCLVYHLVIL